MSHVQNPLPYDFSALEPHIDTATMKLHHGMHHASYVKNLNVALDKYPDFHALSLDQLLMKLEELPEDIRTVVRNNGGGHWAHDLYWNCMSPNGGGLPEGKLMDKLVSDFGDYDVFKEKLSETAAKVFGSGWAWLVQDREGKLKVYSTPGHDCPLMVGENALMVIDVWEHAYYLNYQNRRVDYIGAYWNIIDWKGVAGRLK